MKNIDPEMDFVVIGFDDDNEAEVASICLFIAAEMIQALDHGMLEHAKKLFLDLEGYCSDKELLAKYGAHLESVLFDYECLAEADAYSDYLDQCSQGGCAWDDDIPF